jgi:hypothetical protein
VTNHSTACKYCEERRGWEGGGEGTGGKESRGKRGEGRRRNWQVVEDKRGKERE